MAIFRLQENMPDVYPRKSRDFQLLCNTFDAMFNAVKFDIDSITYTADTQLCSDRLLPLLQTKLGFFSKESFNTQELRTVLQVFKYIVRNKGSRIGIQAAIAVFLKLANASSKSRITIVDDHIDKFGYVSNTVPGNTYIVEIAIEGRQVDTTLLTELLKYVLPAGYQLKYSFYTAEFQPVPVNIQDTIHIAFVNIGDSRAIRATTPNDSTNRYPYELTFKSVVLEDAGESYYFEKDESGYRLIETIPSNWPNGEYYKRIRNVKAIKCSYTTKTVPEYEPGRYYEQGELIQSEEPPTQWGELQGYYSYDAESKKLIDFSTEYSITNNASQYFKPTTDTETSFKDSDGNTYELVDFTDSTIDYDNIYYMNITDIYERVYLPYNSINGVSTTATHKVTNDYGVSYSYPITNGYNVNDGVPFYNKDGEVITPIDLKQEETTDE